MRLPTSTCLLAACLVAGVFASGCTLLKNRTTEQDARLQARLLANRGTESLERGELQQAQALFAEAITLSPDHERAHAEYARVLWKLGKQEEAIGQMARATRLSESNPQYQIELGHMELERGNLEKALASAEAAVRIDGESVEALALRGKIRDWRGDVESALADYLQVLGRQPEYPEIQMATARIYLKRDRPQRALAILTRMSGQYRAVERPRNLVRLQAQALKKLGRHDDAVQLLLHAVRNGPADADLFFELAEAEWFSGEPENSQLALRQALSIDPNHAASRRLSELMATGQ